MGKTYYSWSSTLAKLQLLEASKLRGSRRRLVEAGEVVAARKMVTVRKQVVAILI